MVLLASLGSSAPLMEVRSEKMVRGRGGERPLKADSHIASHAHAVPLPCRALIHTCHAIPLPCSNSAVSFVKVRVVAGNIRTASPTS